MLYEVITLMLEDIINVHQRAKVEEYDKSLFIVTQCPRAHETHMQMEQTSLVLAGGVVLSFQEQPSSLFRITSYNVCYTKLLRWWKAPRPWRAPKKSPR